MYKNLASENFSTARTNILKFVIKLSEKKYNERVKKCGRQPLLQSVMVLLNAR